MGKIEKMPLYRHVMMTLIKNYYISKVIGAFTKCAVENKIEYLLPLLAAALKNSITGYCGDDEGDYIFTKTYIQVFNTETVKLFSDPIILYGSNENDRDIVSSLARLQNNCCKVEKHKFEFKLVIVEESNTEKLLLEIIHSDWDIDAW